MVFTVSSLFISKHLFGENAVFFTLCCVWTEFYLPSFYLMLFVSATSVITGTSIHRNVIQCIYWTYNLLHLLSRCVHFCTIIWIQSHFAYLVLSQDKSKNSLPFLVCILYFCNVQKRSFYSPYYNHGRMCTLNGIMQTERAIFLHSWLAVFSFMPLGYFSSSWFPSTSAVRGRTIDTVPSYPFLWLPHLQAFVTWQFLLHSCWFWMLAFIFSLR